MKKWLFISVFWLFAANLAAATADFDIPQAEFVEHNGFVVPKIEGYELDGTGEETVLPFKRMIFGSEVIKVEILKKHKVTLQAPLKKGAPLYRLHDMHKVEKAAFDGRNLPTLSKFALDREPSLKRGEKIFSFDFYPIIPVSDTEAIQIDRIRVRTKGAAAPRKTEAKVKNSLLILTTEYFIRDSKELRNYIEAKKESGFKIDIATERNYGGDELKGFERFKKIREYLLSVHKNYDFLLIIAGTRPNGDEVPMLVTKPCRTDEPDYDNVPTDIFYAELSEDIDRNENGIYGERYDRISYDFELIVGRIPVYDKNVEDADKILARTAEFIREKPSKAENRRKILFPSTISYYENQDNGRTPKMDGAYVAEYLRKNSIPEYFFSKVLVEKSGLDPSEFIDEEGLNYSSMLTNMNKGYGIVFWQGHGMPEYSVRTIWKSDRNNNQIPETYNYELYSDTFVDNKLVNKIETVIPFVFQGSCLNGTIETNDSLAYNVLKNTAVGVVGASQVSYGMIFSDYDLSSQDIFSYGAVFTEALVSNKIPAETLFETKEKWSNSSVLSTIKHETNYLGDPSLNLNVRTCEEDSDCDDSLFCNGKEICVEGFCGQDESSLPCTDGNINSCEEIICDEAAKSCVKANVYDGLFCGVSENKCVGARQCMNGECTDTDIKDCSAFDSECSSGSCDPETGECFRVSENDGKACGGLNPCLKNEVCSNGFCEGKTADMPEAGECKKTECSESDGFFETADISQNWNDCKTPDGRKGYCDYGICTPKKQQEKESSSSGCSALVL